MQMLKHSLIFACWQFSSILWSHGRIHIMFLSLNFCPIETYFIKEKEKKYSIQNVLYWHTTKHLSEFWSDYLLGAASVRIFMLSFFLFRSVPWSHFRCSLNNTFKIHTQDWHSSIWLAHCIISTIQLPSRREPTWEWFWRQAVLSWGR